MEYSGRSGSQVVSITPSSSIIRGDERCESRAVMCQGGADASNAPKSPVLVLKL